jgi:hypothetical protein
LSNNALGTPTTADRCCQYKFLARVLLGFAGEDREMIRIILLAFIVMSGPSASLGWFS